MFLDRETFGAVVAHTPLVSIDLVITNSEDSILLGLRRNQPARGYWFVPGGRIRKGETRKTALYRIVHDELGTSAVDSGRASFLGVFEHFYGESAVGEEISTHYVVLAYKVAFEGTPGTNWNDQHSDWRWWPMEQARQCSDVHRYTRDYLDIPLCSIQGSERQ